MGGWDIVIVKDAELKQAHRIISILIEEIERKDKRIIDLQHERNAMHSELLRTQIQTGSKTSSPAPNHTDDRLTAEALLRNAPV
jgi:hypothetical protein